MIHLQRNIGLRLRENLKAEERPSNMVPDKLYPVIGYQTRHRKRDNKDVEEISVLIVVNDKGQFGYVYPSLAVLYAETYQGEYPQQAHEKKDGVIYPDGVKSDEN